MSITLPHEWGLQSDITPRFGARLVQEGDAGALNLLILTCCNRRKIKGLPYRQNPRHNSQLTTLLMIRGKCLHALL